MKKYILLLLIVSTTYSLSAQENSKNSITMGLAYGVSVFDNPKKHFPLRNRGSIFLSDIKEK